MNYKLIKIGRSQDNDIVINHASVSRHHAELFVDAEGHVFIRDLNSANGTFINEVKIATGGQLHAGDSLQLGQSEKVDWQEIVTTKAGEGLSAAAANKIGKETSKWHKHAAVKWSLVVFVILLGAFGIYYFNFKQGESDKAGENKIKAEKSAVNAALTLEQLTQSEIKSLDSLKKSVMIDFTGDSVLMSSREKSVLIYIVDGVYTNYKMIGNQRKPVISEAPEANMNEKEATKTSTVEKEVKEERPREKESVEKEVKAAPTGDKQLQVAKETQSTDDKKNAESSTKSAVKSKSGQRLTYRVKKGDSLESIINAQGKLGCELSAKRIMDENGLNDASDFKEGDLLIISCQ
jgi:pSer/pThr/pTyr-binding forkhead associated (FHA) protein